MKQNRRRFLASLGALILAPAIPAVEVDQLAIIRAGVLVRDFGIQDLFLANLFKVLSEHPGLTATQVIEIANEKGLLSA